MMSKRVENTSSEASHCLQPLLSVSREEVDKNARKSKMQERTEDIRRKNLLGTPVLYLKLQTLHFQD